MGGLGVIVEYSASPQQSDSGKDKLSCSGLYLGSGWILTHGTIAIDLFKESVSQLLVEELKMKGYTFNQEGSPLQTALSGTRSQFLVFADGDNHKSIMQSNLPREALPSGTCTVTASRTLKLHSLSHPSRGRDRSLQLPPISATETTSYFCHHGRLSILFLQPGIAECLKSMMPSSEGWRLTEDSDGEESLIDFESVLVSSFALLKVGISEAKGDDAVDVVSADELILMIERYLTLTANVGKGANAFVESSPFGSLTPSVFLNSLSRGIISNVCGRNRDIYLTDARCVMGSEGAPVYTTVGEKVSLCGVIISPFCWKRGEWLGLSLVAAARPVFLSLLHYIRSRNNKGCDSLRSLKDGSEMSMHPAKQSLEKFSFEDVAEVLDKVVVGISCGSGWGSGVMISSSPGIVLTCAHVIQQAELGKVVVITADGMRIPGEVIYHTRPSCFEDNRTSKEEKQGLSIWDIAVVQTSISLPYALPLATQLPSKGSPVVVAGHGIFSPNRFPSPNLSHGIISKIVSVEAGSLSYPDVEREKQINNSENEKDTNLRRKTEQCEEINHYSRQEITHLENSLVSPSMVKADNIDEANPSWKEKENTLKGVAIVSDNEQDLVPVMFQTTCSVYAGNSGGPVVLWHPQLGLQVAGIMVCNTRDTANKATFPHINLAVPAPAISKVISAYISSGDRMLLNHLGAECPAVSQLWSLGLTPQSHL